jgi:hypothetical protein
LGAYTAITTQNKPYTAQDGNFSSPSYFHLSGNATYRPLSWDHSGGLSSGARLKQYSVDIPMRKPPSSLVTPSGMIRGIIDSETHPNVYSPIFALVASDSWSDVLRGRACRVRAGVHEGKSSVRINPTPKAKWPNAYLL